MGSIRTSRRPLGGRLWWRRWPGWTRVVVPVLLALGLWSLLVLVLRTAAHVLRALAALADIS